MKKKKTTKNQTINNISSHDKTFKMLRLANNETTAKTADFRNSDFGTEVSGRTSFFLKQTTSYSFVMY